MELLVIRKIQNRNHFLLTIILTLSILIVGTLFYVLVNNLLPGDTSPPNANLGNTGYLKLPSLPSQDGENSRIFLVSATSTYGVHDGQSSFIINATLRNDYSAQQLPPDASSYPEPGTAYFILHTTLFDAKGTQIEASEITDPHDVHFSGSPQHSLSPGETGWFEIDMGTSSQTIDTYHIDLSAIGGTPIP